MSGAQGAVSAPSAGNVARTSVGTISGLSCDVPESFGHNSPPAAISPCVKPGGNLRASGRRGVAQSGSAPALGAGCRRFESCLPDQSLKRSAMRFPSRFPTGLHNLTLLHGRSARHCCANRPQGCHWPLKATIAQCADQGRGLKSAGQSGYISSHKLASKRRTSAICAMFTLFPERALANNTSNFS